MRKNLTLLSLVMLVAAGVFGLVSTAHAQQPVGIYGYDTGTFPDGGIVRKVKVDSQGRLVVGEGASTACSTASTFTKVWMDGGVQTLAPTATTNRYAVITNVGDDLGAGSNIIKCRTGTTAPTLTAGTPGTVLLTNYSVVYTGAPTVKCVGAGVWASVYECLEP